MWRMYSTIAGYVYGSLQANNCLLKHTIEGKIEGRVKVKGRRGRRREQLLDGLEETRGYWKFKEEAALGSAVWRGLWRGLWACLKADRGMNE